MNMLDNLPLYQCHKRVRAAKIVSIDYAGYRLRIGDGVEIFVGEEFLTKHSPQEGGYYVRYEDGYASFSPAEAFEKGYTEIPKGPQIRGAVA